MSRKLSLVIAWACSFLLVVTPIAALFFLLRLENLAGLAQSTLGLPIQWWTVSTGQWYSLWAVTVAYLSIGLVALFFLRRAFSNFAHGELFNLSNSRDLRRFSILFFLQALATPIHLAVLSLILSMNHPVGEKMLSIAIGSNELKAIGVALILWVMSDLLVEGCKLQAENQQFV